jgi:hypothetical protein
VIALLAAALAAPGVLADPDFRFCHENRAFDANQELCPLLAEVPPGTCPGLEDFCADPAAAPPVGCQPSNPGGPLGREGSDVADRPEAEWERPTWWPSGGEWDGGGQLLAWLTAIVIAFGVGGLGLLLLSRLGLRREPEPAVIVVAPDDEDVQTFAEAVDDVPDLPSQDLLAAARAAAEEGALGEAATLARGAVLRQLGEGGVLRLHRAYSDREYERQTAGDTRSDLRVVLDVAARHRWGRIPLGPRAVQDALTAAARLLAVLALWLVAAPAEAADRFGPAGDIALYRLLGADHDVRLHRGTVDALDEDLAGLLLDTTAVQPSEADWKALYDWVEAGHLLIVTGPVEGLGARSAAADCQSGVVAAPRLAGTTGYAGGSWLVDCGDVGFAAVESRGEGLIVGIADPMVVWNGALMVPDNVRFWQDLFGWLDDGGWLDGPVAFATWGGGASDDSHVGALANLALLPFVLQVLLLWAVVAWSRQVPRREAPAVEGGDDQPFVAHVRAVADHHRRVDDRQRAAVLAARLLLARQTPAAARNDARRLGWSEERATAVVEAARRLADPDHPPDDDPPDAPESDLLEDLWTLIRT